MGCLYILSFPNGKRYVGITTKTAEERFADHCSESRKPRQASRLVCRALAKYGATSVAVETIAEQDDWEALCLLEQESIKLYETRSPKGYNLTDGGDGTLGLIPNEETRQKLSAALLGNRRKLGKKESAETRKRKSEARREGWGDITDEQRARRLAPMHAMLSSPERAAAISKAKLGVYRGGASGHAGITFNKKLGKWRARVKLNQRMIHLGYFSTLDAATEARRRFDQAQT